MRSFLHKTIIFLALAGWMQNAFTQIVINSENYTYPNLDSYTSTLASVSVATPSGAKWTEIKMYPIKRKVNRVKAFIKVRLYRPETSQACSKKSLVYLHAGIGSSASAGTANFYAKKLADNCHHVLILPSIFTKHFIRAVSRTGVVGDAENDMEDYYTFMIYAKNYLQKYNQLTFDSVSMTGYSLGAISAAFLAHIDYQKQDLNFKKVVLINTPVDLAYAMMTIDGFADRLNMWNPIKMIRELIVFSKDLFYTRQLELNNVRYQFFKKRTQNLSLYDKKAIIGFGLSRSIKDTLIAGQDTLYAVTGRNQKIIPRKIHTSSSRQRRRRNMRESRRGQIAGSYNFETYIKKVLIPYKAEFENTGYMSFDSYNQKNSLTFITDFLKSAKHVSLLHNADDFLLQPKDIDYLKKTFGNRMTLYPRGGHLGNFWNSRNINDLLKGLE